MVYAEIYMQAVKFSFKEMKYVMFFILWASFDDEFIEIMVLELAKLWIVEQNWLFNHAEFTQQNTDSIQWFIKSQQFSYSFCFFFNYNNLKKSYSFN